MNILYGKLSNDRLVRWRLLLEEYGAKYEHIKGTRNVVADALSRLPMSEATPLPEVTNKDTMARCFIMDGDPDEEKFPLSPNLIAKYQRADKALQQQVEQGDRKYEVRTIEQTDVMTYDGKIVVPPALQERIVAWYHEYLGHPGQTRLEATIRQNFTWPNIRGQVEKHCRTCHACQIGKVQRKQYGKLPVKEIEELIPWKRVDVDCIGPLTLRMPMHTHYSTSQ